MIIVLGPFLQAGVTLACLKIFGNLLPFIQKLKMVQIMSEKTSAFCFRFFTRISGMLSLSTRLIFSEDFILPEKKP